MSTPEESLPVTLSRDKQTPVDLKPAPAASPQRELGGREGPEPTRFGDWEFRGRCIDF